MPVGSVKHPPILNKALRVWQWLLYNGPMAETLEQRLEELERKVTHLSATVLDLTPRKKDWRSTVGTLQQDELSQEADRLGREYREQQRDS